MTTLDSAFDIRGANVVSYPDGRPRKSRVVGRSYETVLDTDYTKAVRRGDHVILTLEETVKRERTVLFTVDEAEALRESNVRDKEPITGIPVSAIMEKLGSGSR